ncbi:MAG: DpnD/PcfM family protein [Bacteroidales bacterium]|jgi:hypothetical protein|nr:DpnD/PcfM family protein [Bacteroidales bacterium]MDD4703395.1 DpnD/PcfM family protein [Bacteroidales bacterium]
MKKYKVEITETLQRVIEIEAESSDEAYKIAKDRYEDFDIVLDYDDFIDYKIKLVDDYF